MEADFDPMKVAAARARTVEEGRPGDMDIKLQGLPDNLDLFGRFVRLRIKCDWNGKEHLLSELFDDIPVEVGIPEFEIIINATPDNHFNARSAAPKK